MSKRSCANATWNEITLEDLEGVAGGSGFLVPPPHAAPSPGVVTQTGWYTSFGIGALGWTTHTPDDPHATPTITPSIGVGPSDFGASFGRYTVYNTDNSTDPNHVLQGPGAGGTLVVGVGGGASFNASGRVEYTGIGAQASLDVGNGGAPDPALQRELDNGNLLSQIQHDNEAMGAYQHDVDMGRLTLGEAAGVMSPAEAAQIGDLHATSTIIGERLGLPTDGLPGGVGWAGDNGPTGFADSPEIGGGYDGGHDAAPDPGALDHSPEIGGGYDGGHDAYGGGPTDTSAGGDAYGGHAADSSSGDAGGDAYGGHAADSSSGDAGGDAYGGHAADSSSGYAGDAGGDAYGGHAADSSSGYAGDGGGDPYGGHAADSSSGYAGDGGGGDTTGGASDGS